MRAFACLFLAAACGGAAVGQPTVAAEPGIAPRPFTAEQIRAAMPVATELRFRIEVVGQPTTIEHWQVTAASDTTVTIASRTLSESGAVVADQGARTYRWDELRKHATFPADRTARSEGTLELPAGKFETIDYVVTQTKDGSTSISTFRFAKKLPGPPVVMLVMKDGVTVRRMTLLSRS